MKYLKNIKYILKNIRKHNNIELEVSYMNYDKIILEMQERIMSLEERVLVLEGKKVDANDDDIDFSSYVPKKSQTQQIRDFINEKKGFGRASGKEYIVMNCNEIQKVFGLSNRTPLVCKAMYDCMESGDEVISAPPSGFSTTVTIKYNLK